MIVFIMLIKLEKKVLSFPLVINCTTRVQQINCWGRITRLTSIDHDTLEIILEKDVCIQNKKEYFLL